MKYVQIIETVNLAGIAILLFFADYLGSMHRISEFQFTHLQNIETS